jgi:glycine/D-amino acid oxidase-like deaminating enzyme
MAVRAAAMAAAGAEYEMVGADSGRLRLPVVDKPAAALIDVGGGVVDVDAVRDYLAARVAASVVREPTYGLELTSTGTAVVTAAGGKAEYDVVVLAAGANTSHLAAQVGIYTPPLLAHHVRFTFRVDGDGSTSRRVRWGPTSTRPARGCGLLVGSWTRA